MRWFLLGLFEVDLNTKESQAFLREGWGLHLLPSLSPGPSTYWLWDVQTIALKCIPQIYMLCKRMSPEILIWKNGSWGDLASAVHLVVWHFKFALKHRGVLFMENLSGCWTQWSCLPNDPARITAGDLPPVPHHAWYLDPRELEWWISLLALAGLVENPWLNQKACLWCSSLSHKYYRCHFAAPKLLTRQHSYLIRHSTAIHIYLYLNSCPLYYTAGHASAPTPPY